MMLIKFIGITIIGIISAVTLVVAVAMLFFSMGIVYGCVRAACLIKKQNYKKHPGDYTLV